MLVCIRLPQPIVRHGVVADEANGANARLLALVDGENEVDAPVGQLDEPLCHGRFIAAIFLVGLLDAGDIALRRRLVVGLARLGLHFDFKLVLGDLAVALECDAIDDLSAAAERHDDFAVDELGADRGINAGRFQVFDAALDRGRIRPGEIRLEGRGIDAGIALHDNLLSESRSRRGQRAEAENHRQNQGAEQAASPMHNAHSPSLRPRDGHRPRRSSLIQNQRPQLARGVSIVGPRGMRAPSAPARGSATITGVLQFSPFPANLYSATITPFPGGVAGRTRKDGRLLVNCRRRPAAGCRARW